MPRVTRFVLPIVVAAAAHAQGVTPIRRGQELLERHQLADAEAAFRLAANSTALAERTEAERALAVAAWRYHADDRRAVEHFQRALSTGVDTARTLIEWSRFELSRGRARSALTFAERAAADTADGWRRLALRSAVAALVDPYLRSRVDGDAVPASERADTSALRRALDRFVTLADSFPGGADDAIVLLQGALALRDGALALHAWRLYYLLDSGDTLRGPLAQPRRELSQLLPRFSDTTSLRRDDRERLVRAFAGSRLFDAAALVAREPDAGGPVSRRVAEIEAYAAFMRRLAKATDDYYRRTLLGMAQPAELRRLWVRLTRELWPKLDWRDRAGEEGTGAPAPYYPAAVPPELERRFGAVVRFGSTAGYYDLHYGHVVADDAREVEQYGHRVHVRLVVTDGIVSNGFQSWAWDGTGEHGGLQTGDSIIQVRTAFVENPFLLWLNASAAARQAAEARVIAADSAADWARAAADSAGFLPGVRARIMRDARVALMESLRRRGLEGSALRDAFVRAWLRAARESGVFAHEGRHAIDRKLVPSATPVELEYRAKLSEVALCSHPRIALAAVLHPNIGDATAHGRANARIMLGLLRWMRAHAASVRGVDPARPLLPQLPLLTEAQLRDAFRSMDPLASGPAHIGSS